MKFIFALSMLFFSFIAGATEYFPFVQTHTFEMAPYLKPTKGYALFIASQDFTGSEKVKVKAPKGITFPDTLTQERDLTQYSNNMWYISDEERTLSATSGPLPDGTYTFLISKDGKTEFIPYIHMNVFLAPAKDIHIKDSDDKVLMTWKNSPGTDTAWVFAFPSNTKDILNDLIPLTSVMHQRESLTLLKSKLPSGNYKIAIRANRFWEGGTFWALDSEAWSVSDEEFRIP